MPRVVITKFVYAHTNEDALRIAREARMNGARSEIITDEKYNETILNNLPMQDLHQWAKFNNVEYIPSI